jgi:tetratricopeptide (TPR) repeat protein
LSKKRVERKTKKVRIIRETKKSIFLDLVAEYAIYGIAGLMPLIIVSTTHFILWETPKVALLNIFTLIALVAWVNRIFRAGSVQIRWPPFFIPVLVYFGIYVTATVFSLSPVLSIFGIVDRSMGLINTTNLILLYFLVYNVLGTHEQQEKCLKIIVFSTTLVAILGILQYFGINPLHLLPYAKGERVGSTLGNPDYCTPVIVLALPLALAFILRKRFLYIIPLILLFGMLLFSLPIHGLTGNWVYQPPAEGQPAPEGVIGTVTTTAIERVQVRQGLWEAGIKAALRHPILGSGPNTYRDVFTLYEPLSYLRMLPDFREDKAHNEYIEIAQSTGFLGLASFLWLAGAAIWYFVSRAVRNRREPNMVYVAAIVAGLTGYLGYIFLLFHTIAAYTLFWVLLAIGAGLCQPTTAAIEKQRNRALQSAVPYVAIVSLIAVVWLGFTALRPVFADMSFARANGITIKDLKSGTEATEWYCKAADWHSFEYMYLRYAAHALSNLGVSTKSPPVTDPKFQRAFYYIDRAARQEPYNATVYYNRALIYQRSGRSQEEVLRDLTRAIEMYPYYVLAYKMLGDVERSRGDYEKSIAMRLKVLDILPEDTAVMAELGYDYIQTNRLPEAIEIMERAAKLGFKNVRMRFNLGLAYEKSGDLERAKREYTAILSEEPNFAQAREGLMRLGTMP